MTDQTRSLIRKLWKANDELRISDEQFDGLLAVIEKHMGDAGKADSGLSVPPSPARCEISVVTPDKLYDLMTLSGHPRYLQNPLTDKEKFVLADALSVLRPYLHQPEPVSINDVVLKIQNQKRPYNDTEVVCQILDAAGVKYVD